MKLIIIAISSPSSKEEYNNRWDLGFYLGSFLVSYWEQRS